MQRFQYDVFRYIDHKRKALKSSTWLLEISMSENSIVSQGKIEKHKSEWMVSVLILKCSK